MPVNKRWILILSILCFIEIIKPAFSQDIISKSNNKKIEKIISANLISNLENGKDGNNSYKYCEVSSTQFSDIEWLTKLANSIIARKPNPTSYNWDWGEGTLMFGMWKAYEVTSDVTYYNYIKSYVDYYVNEDGSININFGDRYFVNKVCPGIVLLHIYETTNSSKYLSAANRIKSYLINNWHKNSDGGFFHVKNLDQFWIDTLFMSCVFLAKMGDITSDSSLLNEAANQIIVHANKLLDEDEKLFYHAWDEDGSASWADPITHCSPCFWSRGNGWALMAVVEVLGYLPDGHPQKNNLIEIVQNQVLKVVEYQDLNTGLWFTVIDQGSRDGNYLETSASAMFVYGIRKGINKKYLYSSFGAAVTNGNDGLNNKVYIDGNGLAVVTGISDGTGPGNYYNYINIQTKNDLLWGDGAFLLAKSIMCTSPTVFNISGSVLYYSNNNPIKDVIMSVSSDVPLIKNTDHNGCYEFTNLLANGSYTIKPLKLMDTDLGDYTITTYDAALTAQAAVGIRELTQHQFTAADANKDSQIYTYDAALIAQYAVGLSRTSNSHVGEWVFKPDSMIYQPLISDQTNQNFTGIIIGNVHGGWSQPTGLEKNNIVFKHYKELNDIDANLGAEVVIPIKIPEDQKTISADIDFSYNSEVLQFNDVIKTDLTRNSEIVYNNEPGRLRVGLYSIDPINKSGILVKLKFKVLNEATAKYSTLSLERYQLNNSVFMQAKSRLNVLEKSELPDEFSLSQNYPNPFVIGGVSMSGVGFHTIINYKLCSQGKTIIKIYNFLGQEVKTLVNEEKSPGNYSIRWDGRNNNGDYVSVGVYYYKLISGTKVQVKKMIILSF